MQSTVPRTHLPNALGEYERAVRAHMGDLGFTKKRHENARGSECEKDQPSSHRVPMEDMLNKDRECLDLC